MGKEFWQHWTDDHRKCQSCFLQEWADVGDWNEDCTASSKIWISEVLMAVDTVSTLIYLHITDIWVARASWNPLGLLGVILGVSILTLGQSTTDEHSDARVGTRISTLKWVASRLNTSLEICAGLVCAANHVGILHHAQVWAEGSEEHDHEPVSRMWSKGERSAQTLGLLGVILGATILMLGQSTTDEHSDARVGTRISTLKWVASRLNTSLEISAALVCAANHVGTLHHAQVWAEGSEEHDHEPVSRMWSKRERSAQTLGLLGVILGVNRKYPFLDEIRAFYCHTFRD